MRVCAPARYINEGFYFLPSLHLLFGDVKMGTAHNIYKEEMKWNVFKRTVEVVEISFRAIHRGERLW